MAKTDGSGKSVLVTGATGFVGCNLVEALLQRGYRVTCLVRETSDTRFIRRQGVQLVVGDINDRESISQAAAGVHVVYHLAGLIKAPGRKQYLKVNQAGTHLLLETLAAMAPNLTRFVHMSSLAAVGPSIAGVCLNEKDTPNPISWYGESKLLSEQAVLAFSNAFPVTILRPSAVYGPYDRETLLAFRMVKRGCLLTPGRFIRRFSLVHVHDLATACIQAGEETTATGSVYFISRTEIYTWDAIGREIARVLGKQYRQIAFPQWLAETVGRIGDLWTTLTGKAATLNSQKVKELLQQFWLCDSSKARSELNFSPTVDLARGINETVRWYQNHRWL